MMIVLYVACLKLKRKTDQLVCYQGYCAPFEYFSILVKKTVVYNQVTKFDTRAKDTWYILITRDDLISIKHLQRNIY